MIFHKVFPSPWGSPPAWVSRKIARDSLTLSRWDLGIFLVNDNNDDGDSDVVDDDEAVRRKYHSSFNFVKQPLLVLHSCEMQKCCMKKSVFKIDGGGGRNSFPAGSEFANFRPGSDRRQVRRKDGKSVRTFATNWVDICFKYRKHRKAVPNFTSDYKGGEIQLLSSALWERTMCTTWVQQSARTKKLWHREETDSWTRVASAWAFHHVQTVDDVLCWTST